MKEQIFYTVRNKSEGLKQYSTNNYNLFQNLFSLVTCFTVSFHLKFMF